MEQTNIIKISRDVEKLKLAVYKIQEYLEDSILTPEEEIEFEKSLEELKKGEVFSLEEIENES